MTANSPVYWGENWCLKTEVVRSDTFGPFWTKIRQLHMKRGCQNKSALSERACLSINSLPLTKPHQYTASFINIHYPAGRPWSSVMKAGTETWQDLSGMQRGRKDNWSISSSFQAELWLTRGRRTYGGRLKMRAWMMVMARLMDGWRAAEDWKQMEESLTDGGTMKWAENIV